MSTQTVIVIVAVVIVLVLAVGGIRRGPRVTQITRTVRKDKDENGDA